MNIRHKFQTLTKTGRLLCRYALDFVRQIPNRLTLLAITACLLCFMFFIIMGVAWWQTIDVIEGVQPDIIPFEDHLKNVRTEFAEARFSGKKNWDKYVALKEAGICQHSDPDVPDTDGDGLFDNDEIALGTNPKLRDTDRDGLWDSTEIRLLLDPCAVDSEGDGKNDGQRDSDHDGYSNIEEQRSGSGYVDGSVHWSSF